MATAPTRTDAVLVQRLRERDRGAWEELYAAHAPRLRAFAYRLAGNAHDADDLVQETFVRALPRLDRLDPDTVELGPYLFTTLRNLFLKSVERGRRVAPVEEVPEPDTPAPIEDDPERSTLLHRQQAEVRVANARLAPRQRLVLALRELEDRSYAEIGEIVGLKENAVAQLISRARESLRTELRLAQVDPARLPEECRTFLPFLSRHLDGHLRGADLERTLAHLEACERCQDSLASMREAQRRYRTLVPPVGDDEALAQSIDAELTSSGFWERRPRTWRGLPSRVAVLGIVASLLAIAGGAGIGAAVLVADEEPEAVAATSTDGDSSVARPTAPTAPARAAPSPATTVAPPPTVTTRPPRTTRQTTRSTVTVDEPKPKPKPKRTATRPATPTSAPAPPPKATTKRATTAPPTATQPPTTTRADTVAPTVTITARPPATTSSPDATLSFRASEAGATFACRLDGGGFTPCTSPAAYRGLAPGSHTFAVLARDRAGNTGPAATAAWTYVPPDTTPPTVTIAASTIAGGDATFVFSASEEGSTFACSLDGGPPEPCTSPRAYSGLAPGAHAFSVTATDAAGNTGPPASHAWTVAAPLPDLVVSALTETSFTVSNVGPAAAGPFVVSVTLIGTFTFPGLPPGQSATRTWSACRRGTLTAVADRGATVVESDERNNTRSLVSDC